MRVPFIIYADLESLLENISICYNNSKKLSTIKINKHTSSGIHCPHTVRLTIQKIGLVKGLKCRKNNLWGKQSDDTLNR